MENNNTFFEGLTSALLCAFSAYCLNRILAIKSQISTTKYNQCQQFYPQKFILFNYQKLKEEAIKERLVYLQIPQQVFIYYKNRNPLKLYTMTYHNVSSDYNALDGDFLMGQCGNKFEFGLPGQTIVVDMRDCNIDRGALLRKKQEIKLGENRVVKHLMDVSYYIFGGISTFGTTTFNIETGTITILPQFIFKKISCFYSINRIKNFFFHKRVLLNSYIFLMLVSILFHIFIRKNYIMRTCEWVHAKFKAFFNPRPREVMRMEEPPRLQNMERILAPASQALKCRCGETTNAVFPCSHLSSCVQCWQNGSIRRCLVCGLQAEQMIMIYS